MTANVLEAHKQYVSRIEKQVAIDTEIAKRKLAEAKAELKRQKDMYSKYQTFQVEDPDTYKKHHAGKLEFHQAQINATNASIATLQKELDDLHQALPTREEFVELIHSYLETILNTHDLVEEDAVYRELVLNLRANDNSVSVIKLNPPYDMMVDLTKISTGRVEHTLHELLNNLLEDYSNAVSILDELRNACNTKPKASLVQKLVY